MDYEPHIEAEQTMDEQCDQFTGAFFPQAQHFVVAGGNFKSITNITQVAPERLPDFRRFPMGDLDLRNEIRLGKSGQVYRQQGRRSTRRIYSARIHGSASEMTVALYQGDNAEEEWREDISWYSWLRHPNIVQLFGMASACGMHAAIFNEELIPVRQLLEKHGGSHLRMVQLWRSLDSEFKEASQYSRSVSGPPLYSSRCMMWIRPSTGRLCVDPTASEDSGLELDYLMWDTAPWSALSVLEPSEDSNIVDALSLNRYHQICDVYFGQSRQLSISTNTSVQLGAVISTPPGSDVTHPNEIACSLDLAVHDWGWTRSTPAFRTALESGWIRVDSADVGDGYEISRSIYSDGAAKWLAQANHVFHRLGIVSNHDHYILISHIGYELQISNSDNSIPPGYLFLCGRQIYIPSRFRLPDCPAYWSLDPSGAERLSMKEAERFGFPIINIEMKVNGWSWDESVYSGIRQFHQAKGFDPDSQDVARELEYQLYEVWKEPDVPSAYVEEIWDDPSENPKVPDSEPLQEMVDRESGPTLSPTQKGTPPVNNAAMVVLLNHWKIIIGVQFALILTLGGLWLCDRFH